ncbi:MAG: glycosyl hydrolase family 28-related protein [Bryobacteraceae bacterium]
MRRGLTSLAGAMFLFAGFVQAESAVFWVSAPVTTGQAVLVTGYFPNPGKLSIKVAKLSAAAADWHASVSNGAAAQPIEATETSFAFALPNQGGDGVYGFRVDQQGQQPLFERVNLPEIWWTLTDAPSGSLPAQSAVLADSAFPGASLRIIGRCLALKSQASDVLLVDSSGKAISLKAGAQSPYSLSVKLPATLPAGAYTLKVRALEGGDSAASAGYAIQIREAPKANVNKFNVSEFGANGDGKFDNNEAFRTALSKAGAAAPAVVNIPAGGYFLSQPLEIPKGVSLAGISSDETALYFPEADPAPEAWVHGTSNFGIMGLTIYCGNHKGVVSSDMSGKPSDSGHIRLYDVFIRASAFRGHITPQVASARMTQLLKASGVGFETVRLSGPDIVVDKCDLLGSSRSLVLDAANGAIIRKNAIHNGFIGWYNVNASDHVIFEDNAVDGADLVASGGSYSTYRGTVASQNIYTAGNSYDRFMGWDREAITSDGGGGAYFGPVAHTEGAHLTLTASPKWGTANWQGGTVAIVSGHGQGQWRLLKVASGAEVEISRPFDISPDQTSQITIVPTHLHYIFYKNRFSDAGVAIQFYGTAIEHIVAENESSRTGGFHARAIPYAGGIQPEFNVQLLGNQFLVGHSYHFGANGTYAAGPATLEAFAKAPSAIIGMVIRNNVMKDGALLRVDGAAKTMNGVVVEGNQLSDPTKFLELTAPIKDQIVVR